MPRVKKTATPLLSDSIDLNAEPDMEALGDLALPIQFPEDAEKQNKETVKPKTRRPRKKKEDVGTAEQEKTEKTSAEAQKEEPAENSILPEDVSKAEETVSENKETTEQPENNEEAVSADKQELPDSSYQQENRPEQMELEEFPSKRNFQDRRSRNFYGNKQNRPYPQGQKKYPPEEIVEEIQNQPPDPEKIAEAVKKWKELRGQPMYDLQQTALELEIPDVRRLRKQALIYKILAATTGEDVPIYTEGVLEIVKEGYGFLRNPEHNYLPGPDDIYIHQYLIRRFDLKTGDTITGQVRKPRDTEKYFSLLRIDTINGDEPFRAKRRVAFEYLTPIHPFEQLNLEWRKDEYSTRIMNLFMPIGKGQRSIILAPPRTGKTVLLQNIANAITQNHPDVTLLVLLIDERPEEVTEMRRSVKGEVLASTFDEPPERHTQVANMVLEKAKRLVEYGKDVVILLDSITRFARANNAVIPHSGKILSGGVDAMAMQVPKRFFGAARKIENGGSLTIIGTALIETGSRMDEVIFEEFKGTGNMEVVLDRRIAEKRIWPAIDIFKSGTRKEELLLDENTLNRVYILRRYLQEHTSAEIIEFLRDKMKLTETNKELLQIMDR